jgi:hypothetical protein
MALFGRTRALENIVKEQQKKIESQEQKLQEATDILTYKVETNPTYRGNDYKTYSDAITEINKKYTGTADWGVWAGNIIDVRSAFIIGKGIRIVKIDESANPELEWATQFAKDNSFMMGMPLTYATEAEIEGKILFNLFVDNEMVKARFFSYTIYNYEIIPSAKDYLDYEKVSYREPDTHTTKVIDKPYFVYRKFGGRISDPNDATPKLWRSLTQIDEVDKAYRDKREINRLLAAPTPYIKCETSEEAKYVLEQADKFNFKIKKLLAGTGDFKYVSVDPNSGKPLTDEIEEKLKSISGNTGVPVHFMGLPDLMSNRSTAENLMELIWASTVREREIWESAYTELFRKAMEMQNVMTGTTPLDPNKIEIQIPEISSDEWQALAELWLPLYNSGAITLELLLSKIPDIDIEAERKRKEEEDEKKAEEFEKRKQAIQDNLNDKQNDDDNNQGGLNNE